MKLLVLILCFLALSHAFPVQVSTHIYVFVKRKCSVSFNVKIFCSQRRLWIMIESNALARSALLPNVVTHNCFRSILKKYIFFCLPGGLLWIYANGWILFILPTQPCRPVFPKPCINAVAGKTGWEITNWQQRFKQKCNICLLIIHFVSHSFLN